MLSYMENFSIFLDNLIKPNMSLAVTLQTLKFNSQFSS